MACDSFLICWPISQYKWVGIEEAVSNLRIIGNEISPAPKARKTVARGERSEPLVREVKRRSPGGAKGFFLNIFRPFRALLYQTSYQGFAALTPGYYLAPLRGCRAFLFITLGFETASSAPTRLSILLAYQNTDLFSLPQS
jgi:hypothetical protein